MKKKQKKPRYLPPDWYLLQCGCKTFLTDYPFVSCTQCGFINCGSDEQLEKARKEGYLMRTLETGYGNITAAQLQKKYDLDICDDREAVGEINDDQ